MHRNTGKTGTIIKVIHSIAFVLCFSGLTAQHHNARQQIFDSIGASLNKPPSPSLRYDSYNSFISNRNVQFEGIKAGLEWGLVFRAGIGWYWLSTPLYQQYNHEGVKQNTRLRFRYFNIYMEYVFYKLGRWEFTAPQSIGLGNSMLLGIVNNLPEGNQYQRGFNFFYESTITGQYKIIPWVGVGGGVGYRLMLLQNRDINERFNALVYVFRFKLFFGDIYNDLFPNRKKKKDEMHYIQDDQL